MSVILFLNYSAWIPLSATPNEEQVLDRVTVRLITLLPGSGGGIGCINYYPESEPLYY